jgi:hypothetical protein
LLTRTNLLAMTPEYASPEQIRGETATRLSDVYSLGVLAYELLTGRKPYHLRGRIFHEIARVICEEPPTLPSTAVAQRGPAVNEGAAPEALSWSRGGSPQELRRQLAGDVDAILLKSLEKDPLRRYASVAEFGEDVRRHLEGEPVRAKGNTAWNVAWSFLRRYLWWILGAAALTLAWADGVIVIPRWVQILLPGMLAACAVGIWIASRDVGTVLLRKNLASKLKFPAVVLLGLAAFYSLAPRASSENWMTILGLALAAWGGVVVHRAVASAREPARTSAGGCEPLAPLDGGSYGGRDDTLRGDDDFDVAGTDSA